MMNRKIDNNHFSKANETKCRPPNMDFTIPDESGAQSEIVIDLTLFGYEINKNLRLQIC